MSQYFDDHKKYEEIFYSKAHSRNTVMMILSDNLKIKVTKKFVIFINFYLSIVHAVDLAFVNIDTSRVFQLCAGRSREGHQQRRG